MAAGDAAVVQKVDAGGTAEVGQKRSIEKSPHS